ncbi:MAG: branched-chain amino acid ABC transporter permease [Micromonosporaceae bacterium]
MRWSERRARSRRDGKPVRWTSLAWPLVVVGIIVLGPFVLSPSALDMASLCALYLIAGVGLNILMGYTGQVSFGQGAFWAVGAYAVGITTTRFGLPLPFAIVLAVALTAAVAFLIGWPITQLRGHYVGVATLALALITVDLANNLEGLTGGNAGLVGVPSLEFFGYPVLGGDFYRLCWVIALAVLVTAHNLHHSRAGRALRSVGADESGSQALGVPAAAYRLRAFVFAASLAGLGGALYAPFLGFLSPDAFEVSLSALFLIVIVVGGMRSVYGALVGAVVITVLSQSLATLASSPELPPRLAPALNALVYGGVIVVVMRLMPSGLLDIVDRMRRRLRLRPPDAVDRATDDPYAVAQATDDPYAVARATDDPYAVGRATDDSDGSPHPPDSTPLPALTAGHPDRPPTAKEPEG